MAQTFLHLQRMTAWFALLTSILCAATVRSPPFMTFGGRMTCGMSGTVQGAQLCLF